MAEQPLTNGIVPETERGGAPTFGRSTAGPWMNWALEIENGEDPPDDGEGDAPDNGDDGDPEPEEDEGDSPDDDDGSQHSPPREHYTIDAKIRPQPFKVHDVQAQHCILKAEILEAVRHVLHYLDPTGHPMTCQYSLIYQWATDYPGEAWRWCVVSNGMVVIEGPVNEDVLEALALLQDEVADRVRDLPRVGDDGWGHSGAHGGLWPLRVERQVDSPDQEHSLEVVQAPQLWRHRLWQSLFGKLWA